MKEPKRYYCGNGEGMFEDDKNGHWIEYSEHKAIVEALTEQLRKHTAAYEFHCERFDFSRDKKCEQQCSDCYWVQTKLNQPTVVEQNEHRRQYEEFAEELRQLQRQWDLYGRWEIIKKPKSVDEFIDEFLAKKRT